MSCDVAMPFDSDSLLQNLQNLHEIDPQEVSNALVKIIHVLKNTQTSQIQKEFSAKPQNLKEMVRKIKQIFAKQDPNYEKAIILAAELVQKLTASCTDTAKTLLENELLQEIILNTAHQKSSVRKCSRSCIANYVRYYKTLIPILKAFTVYGLQRNDNHYSKQCILLIIPNLINLDSSVISKDCTAFVELIDQVLAETPSQSTSSESEFSKSAKKVLNEMGTRFPTFKTVAPNLGLRHQEKLNSLIEQREQQSTQKDKKDFRSSQQNDIKDQEEEKGHFSSTQQTHTFETTIRNEKFHFGFIPNDIFEKINHSQYPQEKIQAFEEIQKLLDNSSISIEFMEFFTFLADNLIHSTQVTLSVLLMRLIKTLLKRPGVFQLINQQKLSYSLVTKVNETNKLVKQELQYIFQIIQKNIGAFAYINVLLSYLDCNQVDGFQISLAVKNRLLYILSQCLLSVKSDQDFDYPKTISILSKLSNIDKQFHSKVIDSVLYISKHVNHKHLIENLNQNQFNPTLLDQIKQKMRPLPVDSSPVRDYLDFSVTQPQIETLYKSKSKQTLPPILSNGLLSPTKLGGKEATPRSKESSRSKRHHLEKMSEQFYSTEQVKVKAASPLVMNKDAISYQEGSSKNEGHGAGSDSGGSVDSYKGAVGPKLKQIRNSNSNNKTLSKIKKISPPSSRTQIELPSLKNSQSVSALQIKKGSINSGKNKGARTTKLEIATKYQDGSKNLQLIPEFELQQEEESNRYAQTSQKKQNIKFKKGVSVEKSPSEYNLFGQTTNSIGGNSDVFSYKNLPGSRCGNTMKINRSINNASSFGQTEQADNKYQTYDELEPLVNAELEWKLCLTDIRSDNWSRQFEACNILRRACKHNFKEVILKNKQIDRQTVETFHEIMQSLVKMVESLRSSVSKLSMIALNELFDSLPKQLIEQDFDQLFQVLMKKSVDTNIFIFEQADKTLINLCKTMSEAKVFQMLSGQKSNKSSTVRAQVCRCLTAILLKKMQGQTKQKKGGNDIQRQIISIIGQYMTDANQDVRYQAKIGIREIVNQFDLQIQILNFIDYFQIGKIQNQF